jgi:glutathione synthase/RimK-type ligase-like ATP-grasp enzyme
MLCKAKRMNRLCILTPHPSYYERWQRDADMYRALFGDELSFIPWTDADDLTDFVLVMPLLAWGYQRDPAAWFQKLDLWEAQGCRFANAISTLRWNTNKDYLIDLAQEGVAIVPTILATSLDPADLAAAHAQFGNDLVIKPSISGGADGTYRLAARDPIPFDVIEREMLIQPMMSAIATEGEFSLFYFGGALSHAILKKPADGDFRVQEQYGGREVTIIAPTNAQSLAEMSLGALREMPLYARVDMVRGGDGDFRLMELELIEPSLFLSYSSDGGTAFTNAVKHALIQ